MSRHPSDPERLDRQALILQAVIDLLARQGISGVSVRAVAREAGVALGLVSYYYEDKTSLLIEEVDQTEAITPSRVREIHRQQLATLEAERGPNFWVLGGA